MFAALRDHLQTFLVKTLTSRKFWAAVASSIPFALAHDWQSFAMVWMAYAGIQGVVDTTAHFKKPESPESLPDA